MFDRKFVQYFDWGLLGLAIVLGGLGLTTLYSVVTADAMTLEKTLYFKQMLWFCGGLVLMVITCLFNYKLLDRYAFAVYIFCLATLVAVLLFGKYAAAPSAGWFWALSPCSRRKWPNSPLSSFWRGTIRKMPTPADSPCATCSPLRCWCWSPPP